jgi:predicted nucleic acid-binding protein
VRGWLLDTNVVSELHKARPNSKVLDFIGIQPGAILFVTEVTLAEIRYGIEQLGDAPRRADLHQWLERNLRPLFAGRILTITEEVIVRWKTMVVEGRKRGRTFSQPDLFIAAISVLEDLVVVSRDVTEFVEAVVPVFDPWASALYFNGKKTTLKGFVDLNTASEIISKG